MSQAIIDDNYFLLSSVVLGIMVTVLYDLFRIFRRVFPHANFWISLEDMMYWVVVAFSVFNLMHNLNNGTLRWFAILGAGSGMLVYKKVISNLLVEYVSKCLNYVIMQITRILHWILKPFGFIGKKVKKGTHIAGNKSKQGVVFIKKKLTSLKKMLRILLCKQ